MGQAAGGGGQAEVFRAYHLPVHPPRSNSRKKLKEDENPGLIVGNISGILRIAWEVGKLPRNGIDGPADLRQNTLESKELPVLDYEKIAESVMMPGQGDPTPPGPQTSRSLPERRITDERYQGLAAEKGYDQSYSRIQKTRYSHEAMIDVILANPNITQNELAKTFEKSAPWICRIIGSDAFQGALAKRREELTDPFLVATIEERFRGLAMQSLDVIAEKLEKTQSADLALKALDIASKSLGFGARNVNSGNTQQNFVIQLPGKIAEAAEWAESHSGKLISG